MIWLSVIPIGIALLMLAVRINSPKDAKPRLRDEIRTEGGYPKINLTVVKLEGVPQDIEVEVSSSKNMLMVNTNGFTKTIPNEDIIDITVESANSIANNSQFSFGKALVGTAMFGGIGTIAGIHGKNQDLQMLVVSYIKDNDVDYMVFLQQYGKKRSVKAEQFLLKKIKNEMLEVVNGVYDIRNLSNS